MESIQTLEPVKEILTPNPPRYRWLKRSIVIVIAIMGFVVGLWFWWSWIANRRLSAEIAVVHGRGEPILLGDFTNETIPDSENAAVLYDKAFAALTQSSQIDTEWIGWDQTWSPTAVASISTLIDGETTALGLVRQARPLRRAVWKINYQPPVVNIIFPRLNTQRELASVVRVAAFVEHRRGRDDLAIEYIRDQHHEADLMQQYFPCLMTNLVGIVMDMLNSDSALRIGRELNIADGVASTMRPGAAGRQQVMDLIADLSDESAYHWGASRMFIGERLMAASVPPTLEKVYSVLLRPSFQLDAASVIRYTFEAAKAWDQLAYPQAVAALPNRPIKFNSVTEISAHLLASTTRVDCGRLLLSYYRGLSDRRAAVIALALALYRADHGGAWPTSLDELAPRYLQSLPVDPFSAKGAPFVYRLNPSSGAGPIIYSVGENGVDDGGSELPLAPQKRAGLPLQMWQERDAVCHLIAPPPTTEPSESP